MTATEEPRVAPRRSRWSAGRVVSVVLGSLLALAGLGLTIGGALIVWYDQTQRDDAGYLSTGPERFSTSTYAMRTESIYLEFDGGPRWTSAPEWIGDVRLTARSEDTDVFIGIGRAADVEAYLADVEHDVLVDAGRWGPWNVDPVFRRVEGGPASPPDEASGVWSASARGSGDQTVEWQAEDGTWVIVVMNADGSAGVDASVAAAAQVPDAGWVGGVVIAVGIVLLIIGAVLIVVPVVRASRA